MADQTDTQAGAAPRLLDPAMGGSPRLLELRRVSKRFGGVKALVDVDFDVAAGEVLCLAGENGCGKSTLIKIVSGVHAPDAGTEMFFDGAPMTGLDPARARALGIQVIWQDLALFPQMSVAENIAFERNLGSWPRLVGYDAMRRIADETLRRLGVAIDPDQRLESLSIAERQLVAIARALVADARLVFMDEPTASLSRAETNALLAIVRKLSVENVAVVFVSHRLAEVLDVCQRVTVLRDGKNVGTFPTKGMTQVRLTELMTGRSFGEEIRAGRGAHGAPVLKVEGLTRHGEFEDVSFEIAAGEVLGLTGRLGAGRTELALSIFGMTRPDAGTVTLDGRVLRPSSNREAIDAGIAYVSEDRLQLGLVQPQSIAANTAVTVLDRLTGGLGLLSPKRQARLVDDWIGQLAVKIGHPGDPVSTLSGGNQQRIVLAKWLATEPKVLILDSPTVGVDVGARAGIFEIIHRLADAGMAILLISDETSEVYVNADRILHMRDGRLIAAHVPGKTPILTIEEEIHA